MTKEEAHICVLCSLQCNTDRETHINRMSQV